MTAIISSIFHFLLVQFPFTSLLAQFSTFKHDDVSALKIILGGSLQHSHMMTFLYLKVHNGQHKFSVGSVFLSPCHFNFHHSRMVMFWCLNIYVWIIMHDDLSVLKSVKKNTQK